MCFVLNREGLAMFRGEPSLHVYRSRVGDLLCRIVLEGRFNKDLVAISILLSQLSSILITLEAWIVARVPMWT